MLPPCLMWYCMTRPKQPGQSGLWRLNLWCILSWGENSASDGGLWTVLLTSWPKDQNWSSHLGPAWIPMRNVFMTFKKKKKTTKEDKEDMSIQYWGGGNSQILKKWQKNYFLVSVVWVGEMWKHGINLCSHSSHFLEKNFGFAVFKH